MTRNELRLCVLAYLSTLEPIEGSFARNEVSFAIVALQDSVPSEVPEQSSSDSEWIHMCHISVAILDKSPLQGVIFK